jgi:hypothetical protein
MAGTSRAQTKKVRAIHNPKSHHFPALRQVFIPANDPVPTRPDGGLDRARVTAVEILEIVDPH